MKKSDENGRWVKLYEKLSEWGWYKTPHMVHLFLHLVLRANYKTSVWRKETIMRGQLLTGLKQLSSETGISAQSLRTCLARLKSTGEITSKSTNKFSIITICNYEHYQEKKPGPNTEINKQINKELTSNQQTTNNIQEDLRIKEGKEDINITSPTIIKPRFNPEGKMKFLDWVYMDKDQWARIKKYYDEKELSYEDLKEAIRELDRWFGDNPKMRAKRTDDAKALMGWPLDNALKRKRELIYTKKAEEK